MNPLPRVIDPRKLAELGCELSGHISFQDDSRFAVALNELNGQTPDIEPVTASMQFWLDDQRRPRVNLTLDTLLVLQCQRCNQPMWLPLHIESEIIVVRTEEQARSVPKALDYWQVSDFEAELHDLIEDEVLLAIPVIPRHDERQCEIPGYETGTGDGQVSEAERVENPFSALKEMLKN